MRMNLLIVLVVSFLLGFQENLVFSGGADLKGLAGACHAHLNACDAFFCEMTRENAGDKIKVKLQILLDEGSNLEAHLLEGIQFSKNRLEEIENTEPPKLMPRQQWRNLSALETSL